MSLASLCSSCLCYSHNKDQCKGQSRCLHCLDKLHENDTPCPKLNLPPACANCKGPHTYNCQSCPERQELVQRQIREMAACKTFLSLRLKISFESLKITLIIIIVLVLTFKQILSTSPFLKDPYVQAPMLIPILILNFLLLGPPFPPPFLFCFILPPPPTPPLY